MLKWKLDWWKSIAELEAGLLKKYNWNGSRIDEKNTAEMKAGLIIFFAEMEAGLKKRYCKMEET